MPHDKHQAFFDQLAAEWDLRFTAEDLERLEHLVNGLPIDPGHKCLDLGCGTGVLFDLLRRRVGPEGTVTGVDFSYEMAQRAHRNFPFANVNVVDADVTALPFKDSIFDFAISFAAFAHFSDKEKTLAEIHRVLKDGASFCIVHLVSSKELSEEHKRKGGILADDQLPTADQMAEMFGHQHFGEARIEDQPGLYWACAVNEK
jgi:demethylmenaquinone methyltransferase/2-methoxy-6-polyprenyl-1,4-benzoquinol methylase